MRNSVIEAIKQAKFEPATKDGVPVKAVAFVSSTFDPLGTVGQPGAPRLLDTGSAIVKNAISMPKPPYPPGARRTRAAGPVGVRVVLTDTGDVFTAEPISGHHLLQSSAVKVACDAKFRPFEVDGKAVRATGVIFYNFVP
jgi:outer membrane biosynthesis protein TonB